MGCLLGIFLALAMIGIPFGYKIAQILVPLVALSVIFKFGFKNLKITVFSLIILFVFNPWVTHRRDDWLILDVVAFVWAIMAIIYSDNLEKR